MSRLFDQHFGPIIVYPFFKFDLLQISKEKPKYDLHMLNKGSTERVVKG